MSKTKRSNSTVPAAWPVDRILQTLGCKAAQAAMAGKPQPVTMMVLARIEGAAK